MSKKDKSGLLSKPELEKKLYELYPDAKQYKILEICPYNIPVEGYVAFCKDEIIIVDSSKNTEIIDKSLISEIAPVKENGCVFLECKKEGIGHILCRSDMKYAKLYMSLKNRLDKVCGEDGKEEKRSPHTKGERKCPNCGRTLGVLDTRCPKCSGSLRLILRTLLLSKEFTFNIIATAVVLMIISVVSLTVPYINRVLVDGYIKSGDTDVSYSGFFLVILSMIVVQIVINLLAVLRRYLSSAAAKGVRTKFAGMTFEKVQRLSIAKSGKYETGDLYRRINDEVIAIQRTLTEHLPNYLEQIFKLVFAGIFLFVYDVRLALFVLATIPVIVFLFYIIREPTHTLWMKQREKGAQSSSILHDIYSGIRVVKSYGTEEREFSKYDRSSREYRDISIKNETIWALIMHPMSFIAGVGEFFILYFVGNRILDGTMTLGEMAQFSSYVSIVYAPLAQFAHLPKILTNFMVHIGKLFELIDEEEDMTDDESAKEIKITGEVEIEGLSFGYDESKDVLREINLKVKPGEMIGIVGRSGAGKTTLINLIMRMYDPHKGCIRADGVDIRDIPQHIYRSQIGAVLQETYLFTGSIFDNIAYARPDADYTEVIAASKAAGAHPFIMKLPDAYNTVIGEKGLTLSGGERQRVAIARALLRDPKILILDEATASLDTETEKHVQDALAKLVKNRTTFAIAHRLSTLRNATRLIVIDGGKIVETGTHEELVKANGIYASLVKAQRQMVKGQNN